MRRCEISAHAERDLQQIRSYTKQRWGAAQRRSHRQELELALRNLSLNPHIGKLRDDVAPNLRSFRVGVHVALHVMHEDGITVLRVLHPSMDVEQIIQSTRSAQEPRVEYGSPPS